MLQTNWMGDCVHNYPETLWESSTENSKLLQQFMGKLLVNSENNFFSDLLLEVGRLTNAYAFDARRTYSLPIKSIGHVIVKLK